MGAEKQSKNQAENGELHLRTTSDLATIYQSEAQINEESLLECAVHFRNINEAVAASLEKEQIGRYVNLSRAKSQLLLMGRGFAGLYAIGKLGYMYSNAAAQDETDPENAIAIMLNELSDKNRIKDIIDQAEYIVREVHSRLNLPDEFCSIPFFRVVTGLKENLRTFESDS